MQICRKSYSVEDHVARVETVQPDRLDALSEDVLNLAEASPHFWVIKAFYLTPS